MDFSADVAKAREKVTLRSEAYINGKYRPAADGATFDCISPINGKKIGVVAQCGEADVNAAVEAARAAFNAGAWSQIGPKDRKARLLKFAEIIESHADEIALIETLDMGKPIRNTTNVDVPLSVGCIRYYAEALDKLNDEVGPTPPDAVSMIVREPLGVVAAITPWNFPLMMAAWKFAPALAAGNSVIMKPAEQASLSLLRIAEFASEAGIPDGVFNVVSGFGEDAGKPLALHGDVDGVFFTGSTAVGKLIMGYAAQSNMKRVALECGGKSPHIIMDDCPDFDAAAEAAAWGVFYDQGQVCNAGSRLLVQSSIKDMFLEKVEAIASGLKPGNPLDPETTFGAIVDDIQLKTVTSYIEAGKSGGARLRTGGARLHEESGGYYVAPTLFDGVTNDMKIAREEIFGPVISAIEFKDFEEAISIANDTTYGLAAGIWTSDVSRAHKAARRLRAGNVWINCWDASDITTPFGGFKQSGFGRDRSLHALEKYTELKTVWLALR